jgi:two-component system response regulator GlrR
MDRGPVELSPAALKHLRAGTFPENIGQLERLLERAAAYSSGRVIRQQTLRDVRVDLDDSIASMRQERQLLEREELLRALRETGGNITHAALRLGRSRTAVYRLIQKHGIPLTRHG